MILDASLVEWLENIKIFNMSLIDFNDFGKLLFRFAFNTVVILILIKHLYAKESGRKEFCFAFLALGTTIFLLCFLLESVKMELGFALGLFAVFGIIRYRTDAIPIREMTYLFVVIGIAVLNALANKKISFTELLITNLAILVVLFYLEKFFIRKEASLDIIYEKIENVNLADKDKLKQDLEKRVGIPLKRISITKIDFLKDVAFIKIFFAPEYSPNNEHKITIEH